MQKINNNWQAFFVEEEQKEYFKNLQNFLEMEYNTKTIFPPKEQVFSAFEYTDLCDVKVVIVGQDPYFNFGQANGLCFSVRSGQKLPPSLKNIFVEIENCLNVKCFADGDLTRWAKQGVLLINQTLTVQEGKPNSHFGKGWSKFTENTISFLNNSKKDIIFVLWGNNAQLLEKFITNKNHIVLKSAHPSPLSAYRGFFGCGHFCKINEILKSRNLKQIDFR